MKFIKIFIAALAIFGLQLSVASAASLVSRPGTFVSTTKPSPQKHHRRHHYRHRPHRKHK